MCSVLGLNLVVDDHDNFLFSVILVKVLLLSEMLVWLSSLLHRDSVYDNGVVFCDCC